MPTTDRPARGSTTISHRTVRVIAAWVLVAVLCTAGLSVTDAVPAAAAPSAGAQACTTGDGVTVVIDYHGIDGRYYVDLRCAPDRPKTGFAALTEAGVDVRGAARSQGFVCQINGSPSADPCVNESPANAYWSYWLAPRGGTQWCRSTLGAAGRLPPPGTVDAWSFSKDTTSSTTRPPSVAPPPALAGGSPAIPASHCSEWKNPSEPSTPPTTVPPTAPPTTSKPASGGSTAGSGSGSGPSNGGSSVSEGAGSGGDTTAKTGSPTKPGKPTPSGQKDSTGSSNSGADGRPSTSSESDGDTAGKDSGKASDNASDKAAGSADATDPDTATDGDPSTSEEAAARVANQRYEEELAAANVGKTGQASDHSQGDRGSPVPAIFAVVAVVALLGIGMRASRRNRAAS